MVNWENRKMDISPISDTLSFADIALVICGLKNPMGETEREKEG